MKAMVIYPGHQFFFTLQEFFSTDRNYPIWPFPVINENLQCNEVSKRLTIFVEIHVGTTKEACII